MSSSGLQSLCVGAIIVGFAVSLTGFVSPYWWSISTSGGSVSGENSIGLIFQCSSITLASQTISDCEAIDWDPPTSNTVGNLDYFKAVRVLMGVSVFCGLCSAIAGLSLCCSTATKSVLYVCVPSLMAGVTGISAVVTFAECFKVNIPSAYAGVNIDSHRDWAFYLGAAGSGLMTLLAIVTPLAPKPNPAYSSSTVQLYPVKGY